MPIHYYLLKFKGKTSVLDRRLALRYLVSVGQHKLIQLISDRGLDFTDADFEDVLNQKYIIEILSKVIGFVIKRLDVNKHYFTVKHNNKKLKATLLEKAISHNEDILIKYLLTVKSLDIKQTFLRESKPYDVNKYINEANKWRISI